jgi:chromate transport protein ChrA
MPFRRRKPSQFVAAEPERTGVGAFLKRWTIPIIGALTPTALIVVNIAVFIVKNLTEFRWTISILAFVSGLMLNSWAGLNIYRMLQQRRPDHPLVHERNQEIVLVLGMAVIIIAAFLTALFCYLGLSDYNHLPNGLTFFTGVLSAAVPILLRAAFQRGVPKGRGRGGSTISTVAGLPPGGTPTPPPTSASMHQPIPRR